MGIHFTKERMQQVIQNHQLWWQGKLGRALTAVVVTDAYEAPICDTPVISQENCHDFSITPAQVIDALDAQLSQYEFLGDAYPRVNLDVFGPGVIAAFCGAKLDNSSGRVWFQPIENVELADLHVRYDKENIWVKRIKDIVIEGIKRWQGKVMIGFADFGGIMDIASSLLGTEELLFAIMDEPDEVKRLVKEIQVCWHEAYNDFAEIFKEQGAFTDWNGLLSTTPSYILQCDFSIMLNTEMFREFVLDSLREDVAFLGNAIYHLDGVGALHHLDDILSIEDLKAVQFVHGAGNGAPGDWLEVYRKIDAAGKRVMMYGSMQEVLAARKELPDIPLYTRFMVQKSEMDIVDQLLALNEA